MERHAGLKLETCDDVKSAAFQILTNLPASTDASLIAGIFDAKERDPRINFPRLGQIKLPLSEGEAKLIARCETGRTAVDGPIRLKWERDDANGPFAVKNAAWTNPFTPILSSILREVVSTFGLSPKPDKIRLELQELILFPDGMSPLPERPGDKLEDEFGTLMIALPSQHHDDLVAVYRGGYNTAASLESRYTYTAWLSGEKGKRIVTAGPQLVLVYRLLHKSSAVLIARRSDPSYDLTSFLRAWSNLCKATFCTENTSLINWLQETRDNTTCPPAIFFPIEDELTDDHLKLSWLQGRSKDRGESLSKACKETGIRMYLANLSRMHICDVDEGAGPEASGDSQDCQLPVLSITTKLTKAVDSRGVCCVANLNVHHNMCVQEIWNRPPEKQRKHSRPGYRSRLASRVWLDSVCLRCGTSIIRVFIFLTPPRASCSSPKRSMPPS